MLEPQSDAYADVIRCSAPPRTRWLSASGAAACVLAAATLAMWWPFAVGGRPIAVSGLCLAGLLLLARAMRVDVVFVDVTGSRYARTKGWGPFGRTDEAVLDGTSLRYHCQQRPSPVSGLPESAVSAWFVTPEKRLPFISDWAGSGGVEYVSIIAERLGGAPALAQAAEVPRSRLPASGAVVAWVGIVSVLGLMLWPLLSGQRPWRIAFAGPAIAKVDRDAAGFALYNEGTQRYRARRHKDAESLFAQAASSGFDKGTAYNMMAYAQAGQNRLDDALATAVKALSFNPENGMIIDTVGEMHELRKEFEEAEKYYRRALPRLEEDVETRAKLGRTLLALGRRSEALQHLRYAARFRGQGSNGYGTVAADILRSLGEKQPARVNRPNLPFGEVR